MTGRCVFRDGKVTSPQGCEINAVAHCNLTCRGCSHLSPVLRRSEADPEVVHRDLTLLARSYRPQFVKVLGGEPLLHRDLPALLAAIRQSGISERITVSTNGVLLPRMDVAFWRGVDEVLISEYPGQELAPADQKRIAKVARENKVWLRIFRYDQFRESHSEPGTADRALVQRIFDTCKMAHTWHCHTVHEGHFYLCPPAIFLPKVIHGEPPTDGIEIRGDSDFAAELFRYVQRDTPLSACRNCLGSVGKLLPHEQRGRVGWRAPQQAPSEELLDAGYLDALTADLDTPNGCVTIPAPQPTERRTASDRR